MAKRTKGSLSRGSLENDGNEFERKKMMVFNETRGRWAQVGGVGGGGIQTLFSRFFVQTPHSSAHTQHKTGVRKVIMAIFTRQQGGKVKI